MRPQILQQLAHVDVRGKVHYVNGSQEGTGYGNPDESANSEYLI